MSSVVSTVKKRTKKEKKEETKDIHTHTHTHTTSSTTTTTTNNNNNNPRLLVHSATPPPTHTHKASNAHAVCALNLLGCECLHVLGVKVRQLLPLAVEAAAAHKIATASLLVETAVEAERVQPSVWINLHGKDRERERQEKGECVFVSMSVSV